MHSGIAYQISNFLLSFLWMTAVNIVLDSRYSKTRTIILEVLLNFTWWFVSENYIPSFSGIRAVLGVLVFIAIVLFFHTDRFLFKIVTTVLIYLSMVFSEILLGSMLPWEMIESGVIFTDYAAETYAIYLFINFAILCLITICLKAYKNHYQGLLIEKQWFLFVLFPFSQYAALAGWFNSFYHAETTIMDFRVIVMLVLNVLADLLLILAFRMVASNTELKTRNELLSDQINAEERYYRVLSEDNEKLRKIRHDIDNHLYTMQALLEEGNVKEANDYVRQVISDSKPLSHFPDCENVVVASYLEKKYDDCKEAGLLLEGDVYLPSVTSVSNPNLICIFANLIDNAIEACSSHKGSHILLQTVLKDPYLTISCNNPVYDQNLSKKRKIPELERGIGSVILNQIAEKYDGYFSVQHDKDSYHAEIILKLKQGGSDDKDRDM